jgi:probable rRNA maturation factor
VSITIGVSLVGVRVPLSRDRIARAARAVVRSEKVRHAMLSITMVSDPAIRSLNRSHLGRDRTTDVIAFGFRMPERRAPVMGDIYIAPGVARESARTAGISLRQELVRLVVHGTLHVLGYDNPDSAARVRSSMWLRQERLVRQLGHLAR